MIIKNYYLIKLCRITSQRLSINNKGIIKGTGKITWKKADNIMYKIQKGYKNGP